MNTILFFFVFAVTMCAIMNQINADTPRLRELAAEGVNQILDDKAEVKCGASGCNNQVYKEAAYDIIKQWYNAVVLDTSAPTTTTTTLSPTA